VEHVHGTNMVIVHNKIYKNKMTNNIIVQSVKSEDTIR